LPQGRFGRDFVGLFIEDTQVQDKENDDDYPEKAKQQHFVVVSFKQRNQKDI
jgi:hypothetical protein